MITLSREEAIEIAQTFAAGQGWTWIEPVEAVCSRFNFRFEPRWTVLSNAGRRGCNVRIIIDARSRRILQSGFCPR